MSVKPISQSQQNLRAWKNLVDDQVAAVDLAFGEAARLEARGMERAQTAVVEMAKLSQDTLIFWGRITLEWRRLSIDAVRRAADLMIPRG
jgi:hypothetical protein